MRTLYTGEPHVHYGQIYVESAVGVYPMPDECFAGQHNGLCGAAIPGTLFLVTGLHTGTVGFTVELHEREPAVDEVWQEVVEASFRPASQRVALVQWAGEASWGLDLPPVDYRVRYCAFGMDEGRAADTRMAGEPQLDRYLLQFWPAGPAEDRIVRQTSEIAAYWHRTARTYPSVADQVERKRQARLADERAAAEREAERARQALQRDVLLWRGTLPSDRVRKVGSARELAQHDRELVDRIDGADPGTQRVIARAAVHRAYAGAGLTGIDWVAAALAALDRGEDLPAPFDDQSGVWQHVLGDARVPRTIVPGSENFLRQAAAVPAIFQAVHPDPLRAALESVWTAVFSYGTDREDVLTEIRALLD